MFMSNTVVITGCSSGFGRQLAEALARRGDRVYATMRATDGRNAGVAAELHALAGHEDIDLRVLELDVMFNDPEIPTDPGMVVEQIVTLIDTPAGSRPFRSVVGVDVGVRERNAAVEPFDAAVLEAFGLTEFATLVPGRS